MTDYFLLGMTLVLFFLAGWFFGAEIWARRRAKKDAICPTCLSATDDEGVAKR